MCVRKTGLTDGNYGARESTEKPKAVILRHYLPSPAGLEEVGGLPLVYQSTVAFYRLFK